MGHETRSTKKTNFKSDLCESDWDDCDHFLSFVQCEIGGERRLVEMDGNQARTGPLDRRASGDALRRRDGDEDDRADYIWDREVHHHKACLAGNGG